MTSAATSPDTDIDTPADLLMEKYATAGLTRHLAEAIAAELDRGITRIDSDKMRARAMDSLLRAESADVVKLILFRIWENPKPRLAVGCLLLATGIKPHGVASERALACQQNVSPEHVSNGVKDWQTTLGLARVEFQKSPEAVASYRAHNKTNGRRDKIAAATT